MSTESRQQFNLGGQERVEGNALSPETEKMINEEETKISAALQRTPDRIKRTLVMGLAGLSLLGAVQKEARGETVKPKANIQEIKPSDEAKYVRARQALETQGVKLPPDKEMQRLGFDTRAIEYGSAALDVMRRLEQGMRLLEAKIEVIVDKLERENDPPTHDLHKRAEELTKKYEEAKKFSGFFRDFPHGADLFRGSKGAEDALKRAQAFFQKWDKMGPGAPEKAMNLKEQIEKYEKIRITRLLDEREKDLLDTLKRDLRELLGQPRMTLEEARQKIKEGEEKSEREMRKRLEALGVVTPEILREKIQGLEENIALLERWGPFYKDPSVRDSMKRIIEDDKAKLQVLKEQLRNKEQKQK